MPLFRARFDVHTVVETVTPGVWMVIGLLVDVTGSFTAMDISVGDVIIARGYNSNSQVVFEKFKVLSVEGRDFVQATVMVELYGGGTPLNNSGAPPTGSFPIGSHFWYENLTVKASFYQNQFEADYDAGIDNLNLEELVNILKSLTANSFKGGHHCYATMAEMCSIPIHLREWGMHCSVFNDPLNPFVNGNYELVYNWVDTDIDNNLNWRRLCKNIIRVDNVDGGTILAERHKLGYPVPHFYKYDPITQLYNLTQLAYKMDEQGTITWTSTNPTTGYIILI